MRMGLKLSFCSASSPLVRPPRSREAAALLPLLPTKASGEGDEDHAEVVERMMAAAASTTRAANDSAHAPLSPLPSTAMLPDLGTNDRKKL